MDYFKPIFEILDLLDNNILDMINEKTNENINIYSSEFKNEKDKQTTVLMTLEKIIWYKKFQTAKDIVIIDKNEWYDMREWIAEEIATDINNWIKKELIRTKKLENLLYKMNKLNKKDYLTENDNEELLNILEELFNTNENTEWIKTNWMKELFKMYVKKCKDIGRAPKKEIVEWVKNNE